MKQDANGLVLMDMGQHVVQDYPQPLSLHQVLLPGLEDRARAFPPLSSAKQLAPGRVHQNPNSFCPESPNIPARARMVDGWGTWGFSANAEIRTGGKLGGGEGIVYGLSG